MNKSSLTRTQLSSSNDWDFTRLLQHRNNHLVAILKHIIAARFNGMKERRCSSSSDGRSIFNTSTPPHTTHNHSLSIIFPRRRCIRICPPPMGTFAFPSVHSSFKCRHFASLFQAFLPPSQVIVMNISFFNHFMWFIVSGCQGKVGPHEEGFCTLFSCVLSVYLFWAPSVSAHTYSHPRVGEITSLAKSPRDSPSSFSLK